MRARKKELAARMKNTGVPNWSPFDEGRRAGACGPSGLASPAYRLPDSEVFHGTGSIQEANCEAGEPEDLARRPAEKPSTSRRRPGGNRVSGRRITNADFRRPEQPSTRRPRTDELEHVRKGVLANLRNVDEDLARRVADGLAMPLPPASTPAVKPIDMDPSPALSIVGKMKRRSRAQGRHSVRRGIDKADIDRVKIDVEAAGGTAMLIAPKVGGIKVKDGTLKAEGQLAGTPSVLFDAVALVLTRDAGFEAGGRGCGGRLVRDAFGHLRPSGALRMPTRCCRKRAFSRVDGVTGSTRSS